MLTIGAHKGTGQSLLLTLVECGMTTLLPRTSEMEIIEDQVVASGTIAGGGLASTGVRFLE